MTREDAKKLALPKLREKIEWAENWIYVDTEDRSYYHYWPDNTMFGPFKSYFEALNDCVEKASFFDLR